MVDQNNIRLGLSSADTAFVDGYSYSQNQGYFTPTFSGGSADPRGIINHAISSMQLQTYVFPPDLPKYHFTIIQTDYSRLTPSSGVGLIVDFLSGNGIALRPEKRFKMPLPSPLIDSFEVDYEQNYSYTSAAAKMGAATGTGGPGRLADLLGEGGRAIGAAAGITLNQFKTVTMNSPKYREFKFTWKLAPKNFEEARTIQRIAFFLRKAMTPIVMAPIGKALLHFPKIFLMYFSPNVRYLYKFKPCVLKELTVAYNGGEAVPAFYRSHQGVDSESPPESVVISTTWLELEYWITDHTGSGSLDDYKVDQGLQLPTNDPLDALNFYTVNTDQPTTPAPTTPPTQ